jgi:hypothetical protein
VIENLKLNFMPMINKILKNLDKINPNTKDKRADQTGTCIAPSNDGSGIQNYR